MTSSSTENQFEETLQLQNIFELLTIKGLLSQLYVAAIFDSSKNLFIYIQQALQSIVSTIPGSDYKDNLINFINQERPIEFNQQTNYVVELNRIINWTETGIQNEIKIFEEPNEQSNY
ncbi:hypothetical protein F8M41_013015 [Gigaspora margarita]|uniref:Uncharacterized protein n=1 Tax=Gigaspora margarita TaxID=4874 RepID=A0A8H4ASL4_GIGMA|nr:hypothetical protein F8M41_013015 [Gigaspora margarita]